MSGTRDQQISSFVTIVNASTRDICLPDGYELAEYTLRRVYDGHLQSFVPNNTGARPGIPVQATPTVDHHIDQTGSGPTLVSWPASANHGTYHAQSLTFDIPIREGHQTRTQSNNPRQTPSASTIRRRAHLRNDGYTDVCGVLSAAKATPIKQRNHGKGDFCCPRCNSNFTRPKSVKDHFPSCIAKHGNPDSLRYTDHASMAQAEAFNQRYRRGSGEVLNVDENDGDDAPDDVESQGITFEDMNDAFVDASLDGDQGFNDGPHIKTEFVYGADIPYESIETPPPEHQFRSFTPDSMRTTPRPSTFRSSETVCQTPEWQHSLTRGPRYVSTAPDMRATAPYNSWDSEDQTPKPANRDGLLNDGLDGFMDRRSQFSETPAESIISTDVGDYDNDYEMRECEEVLERRWALM